MSDFFCNPTPFQYLALRIGAALFAAILVMTYILAVPYRRAGRAYDAVAEPVVVSAEVIPFPVRRVRLHESGTRKFRRAA